MSGDLNQAKILRNKVNRAASKLKYNFYQTQIAAMHESGSHDWWKHNYENNNGTLNKWQIMHAKSS